MNTHYLPTKLSFLFAAVLALLSSACGKTETPCPGGCGEGQVCVEAVCIQSCDRDSACGVAEVCDLGRCIEGERSASLCNPRQACFANECGQTIANADCLGGTLNCPSCDVVCTPTTACNTESCGTTIDDGCGNAISCAECATGAGAIHFSGDDVLATADQLSPAETMSVDLWVKLDAAALIECDNGSSGTCAYVAAKASPDYNGGLQMDWLLSLKNYSDGGGAPEPRFAFQIDISYIFEQEGQTYLSVETRGIAHTLSSSLVADKWYHLVATAAMSDVDENSRSIEYSLTVDTIEERYTHPVGSADAELHSGNGPLFIGGASFRTDRYLQGSVDEARFLNRALTTSEAATSYAAGAGMHHTDSNGLIAGFHFDETSGDTAADYSSSALDAVASSEDANLAGWIEGHVALP